jgi:hypothetical protein
MSDVIESLLADEHTYKALVDESRKQIGVELEKMRKERNLSFREAAEMIEYDTSNLSKLEKGKIWNREAVERAVKVYATVEVLASA